MLRKRQRPAISAHGRQILEAVAALLLEPQHGFSQVARKDRDEKRPALAPKRPNR